MTETHAAQRTEPADSAGEIRPTRGRKGFSLVELMIVVVIVGVLATLAVTGYTRYIYSSRNAEAVNFLGAIRASQESYFQAFGRYCGQSGAWATNPAAVPTDIPLDWAPVADASWRQLGVRPPAAGVWFQYRFQSGAAGEAPPGGAPFLAGQVENQPWYWIQARSDFDADGVFSTFEVSSQNPRPFILNENE